MAFNTAKNRRASDVPTKEPVADLDHEQFRQALVDELYADSREQPVRKVRKGMRASG